MDKGDLLKPAVRCLFPLLVLAVAVPATARIFTRRPAAGDVAGLLQTLGGRQGYRAAVRINGTPAVLTVTGFDDPHQRGARDILAALQLDRPPEGRDSLHHHERDGMVTRLLLLQPGAGGQTLAVTITQTADAYRQHRLPEQRDFRPLPLFPGATPGFFAENEDTGLFLGTLTTAADPPAIAAFYQRSLAAAGWQPVFPGADPLSGLLFLRENGLCMVLISPREQTPGSRLTLLHKPLKRASWDR